MCASNDPSSSIRASGEITKGSVSTARWISGCVVCVDNPPSTFWSGEELHSRTESSVLNSGKTGEFTVYPGACNSSSRFLVVCSSGTHTLYSCTVRHLGTCASYRVFTIDDIRGQVFVGIVASSFPREIRR